MWVGKKVVVVMIAVDSLQTFSLAGTAVFYIYNKTMYRIFR
jgi:hypothetical protein